MKLSVIIPVYNVQDYLSLCLNSIIGQGIKDMEILLIDDGSTDDSGIICDKYASKHPNIKVVHQQNQGVSHARNVGIENSNGEYLMFVDSDDMIVENSLASALNAVCEHNVDVGIFEAVDADGIQHRVEFASFPPEAIGKNLTGRKCFCEVGYRSVVWSTLFRKSFIHKESLKFKENMANGEDSLFMNYLYMKDPIIRFYDTKLYVVNAREGSASRDWTFKRLKLMVESTSKIIADLYNPAIDDFERSVIEFSICRQISNVYDHIGPSVSIAEVFNITQLLNAMISPVDLRSEHISVHRDQCKIINTSVYLYALMKLMMNVYRKIKRNILC